MHNKWHPSYHHIELPHTAHTSLHILSFIPYFNQCCSVTQACPTLFNVFVALQAAMSFTISRSLLNSHPLSWWCHPTVSFSVDHFSSCLKSFLASGSFPMSQLFTSGGQSIGASVQHQSFQRIFRVDFLKDWLIWSPCSPRDSQESSPTPQFKSINSLAPSLLYGPTLIYINDYWKNHSFA